MTQALALCSQILRARRGGLLGWSLALAATMILMVAIFPAMPKDFSALADQYPKDLLKAFGAESIDQIDTAIGFLRLELFGLMLPLAVAFLPMGTFTRSVTGAEERRYLTPLLALPIGRSRLIAGAALAATAALLLGLAVIFVSSMLAALLLGVDLGAGELAKVVICLFPLSITFTGFAALACGASGRHGIGTAVGGGMLVGLYLLSLIASMVPGSAWLADYVAWSHYSDWINNGPVLWQMLAMTAIAYMMIALAALLFERRDISG